MCTYEFVNVRYVCICEVCVIIVSVFVCVPSVIGHHGLGMMNNNGGLLAELCTQHNLIITNTCFRNKANSLVYMATPPVKDVAYD